MPIASRILGSILIQMKKGTNMTIRDVEVYMGECGSLRMSRNKLLYNFSIEVNYGMQSEIQCQYTVSTHI